MPTYNYQCRTCENSIEVHQAFTDEPLTKCESCGGELRKVFGNLGVSFKGSGFYRTDSAAKPSSKPSSGSSDSATSS